VPSPLTSAGCPRATTAISSRSPRQLENFFNLLPVSEDLTPAYPTENEAMDSQEHILDASADSLNIFPTVVAYPIVQKNGDADRFASYDVPICGLLANFFLSS
jgi:hypothetical protein